jgi:hypothetical protein
MMKANRTNSRTSHAKVTRAMAQILRQLRNLHSARPFAPFLVILNDGRRLRVEQPYRLSIVPNGRAIGYAAPPLGFEQIPFVNVKEVVSDAV